jgi:hypothetical protein
MKVSEDEPPPSAFPELCQVFPFGFPRSDPSLLFFFENGSSTGFVRATLALYISCGID